MPDMLLAIGPLVPSFLESTVISIIIIFRRPTKQLLNGQARQAGLPCLKMPERCSHGYHADMQPRIAIMSLASRKFGSNIELSPRY